MKQLLHIAIILLFISSISCKKEAPTPVVITDPCEDVICINDGVCEDGSCVCTYYYGGEDCSEQITAFQASITSVKILTFPSLDGTQTWDPGFTSSRFPDLHFKIVSESQNVYFNPYYYSDIEPNTVHTFPLDDDIVLERTKSKHYLILRDYDDDVAGFNNDPDFMGQVTFYPYDSTRTNPETIILDNGEGFSVEITIGYTW